mmetsp:Transcript_36678/g.98300  ORF Transcript_36678/g.98300 Transcript_36678/m.98300 type:complete len:217 (+) Transcript_36678:1339-1989(+)
MVTPISFSILFPDASRSESSSPASNWPAPSATTRMTLSLSSSLSARNSSRPSSPLSVNATSGMSTQSTSREPRVACMAMKPDKRPISCTMPTPRGKLCVSVTAELIASCAASTAVSNPNDLSMMGMSLSTVFGIPTTDIFSWRRRASSAIRDAPRMVPSPPIMYTWLIPLASSLSTMASVSCPPRDVPSIVPPNRWIWSTSDGLSNRYSSASANPR